jgi:elongation factor P--(R)-beta-lysine ligase
MTERGRLSNQRRAHLEARAAVLRAVRDFFDERGFLEVETPLLVPSPGLEVHLRAVPAARGQWLITSPEYQMKRLLVAGLDNIFTLCKCFRAEESGAHHSVEFSMLEWYRAHASLEQIMTDTEDLVVACAAAIGSAAEVSRPWDRMTVAQAMSSWAEVAVRGDESAAELRAAVTAAGVDVGKAEFWDDVFFCAFVERVEPVLAARKRPLFLTDWPAPLAALARTSASNPRVAERFEAYVGGLELANAFAELTDPVEQRARFDHDRAERSRRGLPVYPVDERFLAALAEGMPDSSGIALGVDRLIMVLTGADSIGDVQAFGPGEL